MDGDIDGGAVARHPRSRADGPVLRSSGPGGQGVNTTDSRVELSWDVASSAVLTRCSASGSSNASGPRLVGGVLTVTASEHREQLRNRAAAERRLAALVAAGIAPPARQRRATRPTRASKERRLAAKKQRSASSSGAPAGTRLNVPSGLPAARPASAPGPILAG